MKVIDRIRKMSSLELAEFLHYDLTSGDCSDCILNNLDKMEFCTNDRNCCENIKNYLESNFVSK